MGTIHNENPNLRHNECRMRIIAENKNRVVGLLCLMGLMIGASCVRTAPTRAPTAERERRGDDVFTIFFTGNVLGALKPCGCSGGQLGGLSGNKIDATLVGDARIVDDPVRGKVLELDGDGDWVDCGNDLLFGMVEKITISSWIKASGPLGIWRTVIAKGTSWKLQGWTDTLKFVCGLNIPGDIGVDSGVPGKKAVSDGHWHHVAGVYDGRTATLYIDGQRDLSAAVVGSIAINSYNVWIGSDSHRNERALKGRIDDVHIYSYALTAAEVKGLYEGRKPQRDKR